MTWRAIWGEPFPEWSDHATEADAHREALRVSREEGVEVAVVEIDLEGTENGPVRRSEAVRGVSEGEGRGASVRDAERGEEG